MTYQPNDTVLWKVGSTWHVSTLRQFYAPTHWSEENGLRILPSQIRAKVKDPDHALRLAYALNQAQRDYETVIQSALQTRDDQFATAIAKWCEG